MLISGEMRRRAEEMVGRIEHIELETTPDFFDIFVEGLVQADGKHLYLDRPAIQQGPPYPTAS